MKITVKKLQGGECHLDVSPTTTIGDIKKQASTKLNIPVDEQKLLLLGRTLIDEHTIQSYPMIKDGTKLNLIVKKPEGLYEIAIKHFKKGGLPEKEAIDSANRLLVIIQNKFNRMSWDDIDRFCADCIRHERGISQPNLPINDHDGYGL